MSCECAPGGRGTASQSPYAVRSGWRSRKIRRLARSRRGGGVSRPRPCTRPLRGRRAGPWRAAPPLGAGGDRKPEGVGPGRAGGGGPPLVRAGRRPGAGGAVRARGPPAPARRTQDQQVLVLVHALGQAEVLGVEGGGALPI